MALPVNEHKRYQGDEYRNHGACLPLIRLGATVLLVNGANRKCMEQLSVLKFAAQAI
jgi:hypothetical protein